MDSLYEIQKTLRRSVIFKVIMYPMGIYFVPLFVLNLWVGLSIVNGYTGVEYWGPVHWPLKLLRLLD